MTITRLTTTTSLARAWRNLTHGVELRGPSVWLMLLDAAHRPVQPVIELEDATTAPAADELAPLVEFLTDLTARSGRGPCGLAVLRSRPGRGLPVSDDEAWASAMQLAAAAAGVACLGVHFANAEHLVALTVPLESRPDVRGGA